MGQRGSRVLLRSARSLNLSARSASTVRDIGVLGVPLRYGQRKLGVEDAPAFLREAGLLKRLSNLGYQVRDHGNVRVEGTPNVTEDGMIESDIVGNTNRNIRDAVVKVLSTGSVSLNLGGDHSFSIGTVAGHAAATHSDVALLWVDAHPDMNTPRSSTSGNIHGMAVSFLLHEMSQFVIKPKSLEWVHPCVHKENFAFIALRDVDPYERYFMDELGITHYDMAEIDRIGIRETIQRALKKINPTGTKSLHVSFDIDSVDKLITPSTGTPVIGGLSMREAFVIAEEVYQSGQLRVLDIAEVNPRLGTKDDAERTVGCGVELINAFFGSRRRGNLPLVIDPKIIDVRATSQDVQSSRQNA